MVKIDTMAQYTCYISECDAEMADWLSSSSSSDGESSHVDFLPVVKNMCDKEFRQHFRLRRETFDDLLHLVGA